MTPKQNTNLEIKDGERSSIELMKYIDGLSQLSQLLKESEVPTHLVKEEFDDILSKILDHFDGAKSFIYDTYFPGRYVNTKADISGGSEIFTDSNKLSQWKKELTIGEKADFIIKRTQRIIDESSWNGKYTELSKKSLEDNVWLLSVIKEQSTIFP